MGRGDAAVDRPGFGTHGGNRAESNTRRHQQNQNEVRCSRPCCSELSRTRGGVDGAIHRSADSDGTEEKLPACCYRRSLEIADRLGTKSIAFPALRTGIYGFLKELATQIAVAELASLRGHLASIFLVCFHEDTLEI
jgi:O-acetyl-ADP-ribose deacetylase (regulator of RNase III)